MCMCVSFTLTRWAMRAGDLKTIHWSTAMVSWSSSFWMVMSPPKNSSENGDTSVQSYRKIWGSTEISVTRDDRAITTNTSTHLVTESSIITAHPAWQLFCGVGWKCPISKERLWSLKCVSREMSSWPICDFNLCITPHPFFFCVWRRLIND